MKPYIKVLPAISVYETSGLKILSTFITIVMMKHMTTKFKAALIRPRTKPRTLSSCFRIGRSAILATKNDKMLRTIKDIIKIIMKVMLR